MSFIDSLLYAIDHRKPRSRGSYIRQTLYCTVLLMVFATIGPVTSFPIPGWN